MKSPLNQFLDILIRYLILILIAFPGLWIFYFIFTPLTLYSVYFLLNLFYETLIITNIIVVNETAIELIGACIAGSAYYLLLILNLSVPKIKLQKRVKMILFAFCIFLVINILRIFLLSLMSISVSPLFEATHKILWYSISTLFVVGIWFFEVKLFKINQIPFYSDIKFLFKKSKKN